MQVGLGMIMIFAKDLPRLRDFYCDVLGFVPLPNQTAPQEYLVLKPGQGATGVTASTGGIALHRIPDVIARHVEILDPPQRRSDTALKFILHTPDLSAVRASLQAHGVSVDDEHAWDGRRYFDAVDPEGNVFQISSETSVPLG